MRVDIILRTFWNDPRLAYDNKTILNFNGDPTEHIWVPDIYITNARETNGIKTLKKNIRSRYGPKGNIYISAR